MQPGFSLADMSSGQLVVAHGARACSGRSETSLALSVGGGVDFSIWRGLAVGRNITFMKFFGGRDVDLTRVGAKASYRF